MHDVLKIGKKALTYTVVATTILWSIGAAALVAPLVASAQTTVALNDGDVVKGASTKDVFVFSGGKRFTFPTSNVFLSWFKDYKSVKTVSDAQLGGITIAGTVAYRPGTNLVKIATNPKVYAVEPGGTLRWIETEAIATALFGSNWNKRVHDVSPAIFPYVYHEGSSLSSATPPSGSLVKVGSDVWLVTGTTKQKVSAAGLAANRLDTKFALSGVDVSGLSEGAMIDGEVVARTNASQVAVTPTPAPTPTPGTPAPTPAGPVGSGLTVALAADTPAAATVITDSANGAQALIPALKLNFSASSDGDVTVKTVAVTRSGVSADTDVVAMYLYDGDTQIASSPSVSTKKFTFTNSSGLFTVVKGTTKTITVKFDLLNNGAAGKVINLGLAASGDVATNGAAVNGTFPVTGSNFSTALVTDLGKFTLTNVSPTAASNVNAGSTGYEIWRLQAVTQQQDVELRKVKFTIVGSVNVGDLKNLSFWDGATQIGATVPDLASDKTFTFDMTAAPYVFTKGSTKTLSVKADVIGGSTRTFRASIQAGGDLVIYDRGYGVFLKHAANDTFTVLQPNDGASPATAVSYTVSTGTLSVSVTTDSPTGNVASSTTGVTLGKFNFLAAGEDVKITSMDVTCSDSTNTKKVAQLKILWNGSQVGTTVTTSAACDNATKNSFTLGSTMIARVGVNSVLTVVADLTNSTTATETISVSLATGSSNATTLTSLTTLSTGSATGRTLTIQAGTVTVSKNSSFGDKSSTNPTGAVNAQGVKIGSFVITGGAGEDADVSQIALKDIDTTSYLSNYTQNVKLMHGTTLIAPVLASPASGASAAQTHTFNVSPVVTVPAGGQYVVDIVADLKANTYTTAAGLVNVNSVVASGHRTGTSANSSGTTTLQNVYISGAGGLGITISADTPLATNLLMGATDQTLAKFQLTASSTEPINITQLVVSSQFASAATGTLKNVRLYDDAGALIGTVAGFDATQASNTNSTGTYAGAKFTGINLTIPAGVTKMLTVKADLASYVDLGVTATGQAFKVAMLFDVDGTTSGTQLPVTGTGQQSGVALGTTNTYVVANGGSIPWSNTTNITGTGTSATATTSLPTNVSGGGGPIAHANEFVLYRTKVAIAWDGTFYNASGVSSPNGQQTIGKFVVTNAANAGSYAATVDNLNFTLSTTLSITATNTAILNVYKDGINTTALSTTTFAAANAGKTSGTVTAADSAFNTAFEQATETTSGGMTDVEVAAGGSKTFFVTLDTSNMTGAAQSTKNLTIQIVTDATGYYGGKKDSLTNAFGFVWSDNGVNSNTTGGTANVIANDNLLPLSPKTFSYSF